MSELVQKQVIKLQADKNREINGITYYKYRLHVPPSFINQLDWNKGDELSISIGRNGNLLISKIKN